MLYNYKRVHCWPANDCENKLALLFCNKFKMALNFQKVCVVLLPFFLVVGVAVVDSLRIEEAYDIKCLDPFPRVARNVDYSWIYSIPQFYIPMQSKLHFYRYAETLLQTRVEDLTNSELNVDKACIYFKWTNPIQLFGYGEKSANYTITHVIENKYGFNTDWAGDTRGRNYITLKDNKTFFLFTSCWIDGQASWSVMSTEPQLAEETEKTVLDHVRSLGFSEDKELIVKHMYKECSKVENQGVGRNEL